MSLGDSSKACREKYWEEKTDSEKIIKLGQVVELLSRRVLELEEGLAHFNIHLHQRDLVVIPAIANKHRDIPYYYQHTLGKEPPK